MKYISSNKPKIIRPVIYVEYTTVLQAVKAVILAYVCCFKQVQINVTCDDYIIGRIRFRIIPIVRLIRR